MSVPVRSSLHLVKKKKAGKQKQSSGDQQSFADFRKLYHNLQKEHERVGTALQNLKEQNEELAQDFAEQKADLEELANLVRTKDEAIKNIDRRLLREPDHQQQTPQQQLEPEIRRVSSHSLSNIHSW